MTRARRDLAIGTALLLVLGLVVMLRIDVATDITHFLPAGDDDAHGDVLLARELASGELSRTMVLLVDAPDAPTAARASHVFERELRADPDVQRDLARLVAGSDEGQQDALWQTYQAHRTAFLAPDAEAAAARVTDAALAAAAAELKRKLATPMSTLLTKVAPADPLLILPDLFERLLGGDGAGLKVIDGRFVTADERGAVLFLTSSVPTSNATRLRPLLLGIDRAFERTRGEVDAELSLQQSGTHLFAIAAEGSIRADIQRVSIGSSVGLVLLFLLTFRSLRLMLLVLPVLASGFLCGTVACLLLFGSVHGLTLAFGAALIGVAVDYGVHFHCHHLHAGSPDDARASLRRIWPGLRLGALTTITGFVALLASTFPGLRQLAVFAVAGIAAAALSTWLFLPGLSARTSRPTRVASALIAGLRRLWFAPRRSRAALLVLPTLALVVAATGLPQLRWNDDLTDLNRIDPAVQRQDQAVRDRVVRFEQRRLVVATGRDEAAALLANERAAAALADLQQRGALTGFRSLAPMLPSPGTQTAVDAVLRGDETHWPRLANALAETGFVADAFTPWRDELAGPAPAPLTYTDLANGPLAGMTAPFRFTWSGGSGFVTFLHELQDEAALRDALAAIPDVRLIDIAATLSSAYGAYRARLLQLWCVGLGGVLLLVLLRHRRLRPTMIAYLPAVLGAAATAGLLSWFGLELNMLSLVALLMVVSMGVDYGVFLAEHRDDGEARDATLLAVLLAALSTMLGFGLLALSSQPPLFHIGVTAAVGVLTCVLLAPTVCALLTANRGAVCE